jgi:hypothetical protein
MPRRNKNGRAASSTVNLGFTAGRHRREHKGNQNKVCSFCMFVCVCVCERGRVFYRKLYIIRLIEMSLIPYFSFEFETFNLLRFNRALAGLLFDWLCI